MDNLKRPAYPQPIAAREDGTFETSWGVHEDFAGFTKIERASLMIAQGRLAKGAVPASNDAHADFAYRCVAIAKAVLEEANK